MKILFDTNVVLDLLLERHPYLINAEILFSLVETGKINGFLAATTLTTIHYLATKAIGAKSAQNAIKKLLQLFEVAPINRIALEGALNLHFKDFEDAVLHEAAYHIGAEAIVTRNKTDFSKAKLAIYTPETLCQLLEI